MPRKTRIDAPGALHHIIVRGIERKAIFKDDQDYRNFLDRLGSLIIETSTPCYAWVLMGNHVHLLLETGKVPLSTIMRRLLTGYAQQYNRRHRRHGHLFQNRYKSILCDQEPYLLELVRYIHLNPIRAKQVKGIKALATYWRSGHSALMGRRSCPWQDTECILALFGRTQGKARNAYEAFVQDGVKQGPRPDLVGGGLIRSAGGWSGLRNLKSMGQRVMGDERILGDGDFVEKVIKQADAAYDKRTYAKVKGIDLTVLANVVAKRFKFSAEQIRGASKQRQISRARSIVSYLAIEKLGIRGAELARRWGVSPSAVSKAAARGRMDSEATKIENKLFPSKKQSKKC